MTTYLIACASSLVVSWLITLVVRNGARARGLVDDVGSSSRKIHTSAVPRLGGVAIVLGFYTPLLGLLLVDSGVGDTFKANPNLISALIVGGIAISVLGIYDDLRGANAAKKLAVQTSVAVLLWALGIRIDTVAQSVLGDVGLEVISLPLTVLWVVGIVNALNLIDGLDGLAGGVAIFAALTNFILAFGNDDILMALLMSCLGGAVAGFLVFNFNPATIFMGDTGSMFLGFALATASIRTSQKSSTALAILVPVLALGLPIMDTLLTICRRALRGRGLFSADKDHIHHRMMTILSLSHRHAVFALYAVCCVFAAASLLLSFATSEQSAIILAVLCVTAVAFMRSLGYMRFADTRSLAKTRHRNRQLRQYLKHTESMIRSAVDVRTIEAAIEPLAAIIGASSLRFIAAVPEPAADHVALSTAQLASRTVVRVVSCNRQIGYLELEWNDARKELDRDDELALEALAVGVGREVERLERERVSGDVRRSLRVAK